MSGFSGAGFSVCCGWGLSGCVCERGFLVYSGKRRVEPFPLSARYALGCKFSVLGNGNQLVWVVFVCGCGERGLFCRFLVHVVDLLCTGGVSCSGF